MKISRKIFFGYLFIIFLTVIIAYIAIIVSQRSLKRTIIEDTKDLAVEIMDKIDRNIYGKIEIFMEYSRNSILVETVMQSNQKFEKLDNIEEYIAKIDKEWTSVSKYEVTPSILEIMSTKLSGELRKKIEFYEEAYDYRVFGEVFVTNKYGANSSQTGKTSDYKQDDEEWWQRAKKNGLYVRDVEYDESAGIYSTDIGIRIEDKEGNFIGVMKVVLNIEEAIEVIKRLEEKPLGLLKRHKAVHYKLATQDGRLIYSTKDFKLFEDLSDFLIEPESPEGKHVFHAIRKGHEPGEGLELTVQAHSRGHRDFKGLAWVLSIDHTFEDIFAPIIYVRNQIAFIVLILCIVAVLSSGLISHSISRSINILNVKTREIADGNLDTRVDIKSKDEVGLLADSFNQMTENLQKMKTKLELLSFTDELTGLNNRRGFFVFGEHLLHLAKRKNDGLVMLYADLDGLKRINDGFGHKEGDNALIDFAKFIRTTYRDTDIIARIGGDEFAVLSVDTTRDCNDTIAARLQDKIVQYNITSDRRYNLSASLGIVYVNPESLCSIDDLLAQGDKMMYEQKMRKKKS
jgi:diguanylate cyclase (GGDEF)-like protein